MANTKILTSLHGRRIGLNSEGKLIVNGLIGVAQLSEGACTGIQPAPGVLNSTGTLTAALIKTGIVTSTTGAAVTATVDTGTDMDTAFPNMKVDDCFDWCAIATGANAFTVTAASGHTLVGSGVVATGTSKQFRTRKTAAATYVTFNIG